MDSDPGGPKTDGSRSGTLGLRVRSTMEYEASVFFFYQDLRVRCTIIMRLKYYSRLRTLFRPAVASSLHLSVLAGKCVEGSGSGVEIQFYHTVKPFMLLMCLH
jgi:hypothetical protein